LKKAIATVYPSIIWFIFLSRLFWGIINAGMRILNKSEIAAANRFDDILRIKDNNNILGEKISSKT